MIAILFTRTSAIQSQNFPSKNMIHEKYKNNGKELNKNKIRSSNYTFNKVNYFNKKNPYLINNSEITFNKNAKREIELKYHNEALNYLNNNKSKNKSNNELSYKGIIMNKKNLMKNIKSILKLNVIDPIEKEKARTRKNKFFRKSQKYKTYRGD